MKRKLRTCGFITALVFFLNGTAQTLKVGELVYTAHSGYASVKGVAETDCSDLLSMVEINGTSYPVTEIEAGSSGTPSLTTTGTQLTLPISVTKIGDYAFSGATFTTLDIPENVTEIGSNILYSSSVTTLNYNATDCTVFGSLIRGTSSDSKLKTVVIGENVETVPAGFLLFNSTLSIPATSSACRVTSLTVGKSVRKIGSKAFTPAIYLTKLNYRSSYMSSTESRFGIRITDLKLAEGITLIPDYFIDYRTGGSSSDINSSSFSAAGVLTSLTIPSTVQSIGKYAFVGQKNLTSVECQGNIGECAFSHNSSLKAIVVKGTIAENAFKASHSDLYVVAGSLAASAFAKHTVSIPYGSATGYHEFPYIEFTDNCKSIGAKALSDNSKLRIVKAPAVPPTLTSTSFHSDTYSKGVLIVPVGSKEKYQQNTYWKQFTTIVESDYFPTGEVKKVKLATKVSDRVAVSLSQHNSGDEAVVEINPAEGWTISAATFNGTDVLSDFNGNSYTTPPLEKDSELTVELACTLPYEVLDVTASLTPLPDSDIKIRVTPEFLVITGLQEPTQISLYSLAGLRLFDVSTSDPIIKISLKQHEKGLYILAVGDKRYKVKF